jgi:hypothetical protein
VRRGDLEQELPVVARELQVAELGLAALWVWVAGLFWRLWEFAPTGLVGCLLLAK